MLKIFALIVIELFCIYAKGIDQSQVKKVGEGVYWQKLLHYQDQVGLLSKEFYLASHGKYDSVQEFEENLIRFQSDAQYSCRFPARANLISKNLNLNFQKCQKVENWKKIFMSDDILMVYVSQYVSNPASVFGHTFLFFQNKSQPEYLNSILNYAANVPQDIGLFEYLVKGLNGGFEGKYDVVPYYIKLREYNNIENRDMWFYQLRLSDEEKDQLLNHIWELMLNKEGYFFANRNCSYAIYNAIAAIVPELPLLGKEVYVLPVQTVQNLKKISVDQRFVPSLRKKILFRYQNSSVETKKLIEKLISLKKYETQQQNKDFSELSLEYYEFLKTKFSGQLSEEDFQQYQIALSDRAKLGPKSIEEKYENPPQPYLMHSTSSIGVLHEQNMLNRHFGIRASFFRHSLLQRSEGFIPNTEIVALDLTLGRVGMKNQLTLVSMKNFEESNVLESLYSWEFSSRLNCYNGCSQGTNIEWDVSIGKSKKLNHELLSYILVGLGQDPDLYYRPELKIGTLADFGYYRAQLQFGFYSADGDQKKYQSWQEFNLNFDITHNIDFEVNVKRGFPEYVISSFLNYQF